jgi:SAM-dependent methyltransferase
VSLRESLQKTANQWPVAKAALKLISRPFRCLTSEGYARIDGQDRYRIAKQLRNAWRAEVIPARQRAVVDAQLQAYRRGRPIKAFDVLVEMLRELRMDGAEDREMLSVLEVGCSSGYYSEIFAMKGLNVVYAGCDYSSAFIAMARQKYPALDFRVEDATSLTYADKSYDAVVSGCCLLHIPEYELAIRETARVARRYAIFYRTPVLHTRPTTYHTKLAYGTKTIEIHFNEQELVALFAAHGLCDEMLLV